MNDKREAIRVMQPDGSIKIVFRTAHEGPARKEPVKEPEPAAQAKAENKAKPENKKKGSGDGRYFNPWHEGHSDIFGKDLIGKNMNFTLLDGNGVKGKLIGIGQYDALVEAVTGSSVIVMKGAIVKIEVL